ncbi:MAG TPA: ABC transporter ATP-binding protein, partial [Nakamurella sp.]
MSAPPAVQVDGLSRRFGAVLAVDDLSFTVETGSLLTLLGPNGAGKTTTVEVCEGFQRPDKGSVRVLGLDPISDQARLRPRLGVMLQTGGAHGSARTAEMLELIAACAAHPLDPAYLLDLLGLSAVARTSVRRLSGGQAQRLSLAMALVGRPQMLFLDEPTAGMDPQTRHLVWELLRAARSDGVTILLTTHLMDEAELLSDRLLIIDHGRAVAAGT